MFGNQWRALDPWREFSQLQDEINRLFGLRRNTGLRGDLPAFNVWRNETGVVLTSEIPGLDPNELDLSVNADTVTIRGSRPTDSDDTVRYHRRERLTGKFTRSLQLPFRVDAARAQAKYERGVLTIFLPHHEEEKPKKVAVQAV